MKITIVHGKDFENNFEVNVDKFDTIRSIKTEIWKYLIVKENNFLIYKNMILQDANLIAFYKICENDEIWWGRIENYLKCDDVVIDLFLISWPYGILINLIVNGDNQISCIRSILTRILINESEIVDIWNDCGESLVNDQIISAIDTKKGERRIICRLHDGDIDRSFDECCNIYDRYLMHCLWSYRNYLPILDSITWQQNEKEQITDLGQIVLSTIHSYDMLSEDVASWARCLQHSRLLCCTAIADHVWDIVFYDGKYQLLVWDKYRGKGQGKYQDGLTFYKFQCYLYIAICASVLDYVTCLSLLLHQAQQQDRTPSNQKHKSISDIVRDAVERYLLAPVDIKQCLLTFLNKMFIKRRDDIWMKQMLHDKYDCCQIAPRGARCHMQVIIPHDTKTILQFKKAISLQTSVPLQQLYVIDNKCDIRPKDENPIHADEMWRFSCQIVFSMNDVKILTTIGRGCFGEMLLCQHKLSENVFALKIPYEAGNLDREIIIHSIINENSFNICRHRGLFSYQGTICSAMDYKSGGTLDEFIKKRKCLQEHEIARISREILIQIKEMHNRGVIHRDIKPDNIVLDENGSVYLIDFGTSKLVHNSAPGQSLEIQNKSSPGTVYYMAPELASDDSVTEKIDTWSFGVVVIEMVNGRRPYHNLSDYAVMMKIVSEKKINFELPHSVTYELRHFIYSCVEPDPIKRATIDELIQSNFIKYYNK